jgi:hypothetical protein
MAEIRETYDDYHAVIAVLNERWRVIDSCERYPYRQWILQYRSSADRPNSWTTKSPFGSFCQTKAALLREAKRKITRSKKPLTIDPIAWQLLENLPDKDLGQQQARELS